jgi:hypothetical protein
VKRELRRIFAPKRNEVTGGWRKLHNEGLHNLYCSLNVIRKVKSRKRWAGHVGHTGRLEMLTKFWLESLKGTDH